MHNIAMFSTQAYDRAVFDNILDRENVLDDNVRNAITITYFDYRLTKDSAALCNGFHTVCVFVNDDVSADTIDILHQQGVKHITLRCAGFNNVDIDRATQYGITVSRVPAYSPHTVAEHTLALILTLNRKTHKAYNRVKEGNFALNGLLGFTLHGKTVGVVGTGNIGNAVIDILKGFGCNILCYDPYPNEKIAGPNVTYVNMETLFTQSTIVTLHCPLNSESHHLINDRTLSLMQKGAMLINTSRGGLLDDKAVIRALKSSHLGYLGLDVYERESELFFSDHSLDIISDDVFQRLLTFPNVVVTGHQGFFTQEALHEIASVTLRNILVIGELLHGDVSSNIVDHT